MAYIHDPRGFRNYYTVLDLLVTVYRIIYVFSFKVVTVIEYRFQIPAKPFLCTCKYGNVLQLELHNVAGA